jgi:transcriptional regulator with XRE-family HTH domain
MLNRALRLLRTYHQISQQDLAHKLELSNSYLSEVENGVKSPSLETLQKYSAFFRMPLSSILLFSEEIETRKKPGSRLRVASAEKILRLLEWIDERDEVSETV